MKVLFWGSRNLTWKHLPVARALALHSTLELHQVGVTHPVPELSVELVRHLMETGADSRWPRVTEQLVLLNGDGPPGRTRGAVGADKLCLLACMEVWPEARRRVRWFPPEPKEKPGGGMESWPEAAGRRNVEMASALPERAYCLHTDLDSSKGSSITANAILKRGWGFWYCRLAASGELISIERRHRLAADASSGV